MTTLLIAVALLAAPDYDMSGAKKADSRRTAPTEVLLIELSSTLCAACTAMRPVIRQLTRDGCRVSIVDVDDPRHRRFVRRFKWNRTALPTWILSIDGTAWETRRGMLSYNTLRDWYWRARVARAKRDGVPAPRRPVLMAADMIPRKVSPVLWQRPAALRFNRAARGR